MEIYEQMKLLFEKEYQHRAFTLKIAENNALQYRIRSWNSVYNAEMLKNLFL